MQISAVIITLNEERNIGRCLESLQAVADEILVIDSGSEDRTAAIATSHGATVIDQEWLGYAATKNKGNELARYDHILSLDADEALSPKLKNSILEVKSNLKQAYQFNRLNNYCGHWIRHGGFYPDRKIRLFDKTKARWQGGDVHETLLVDEDVAIQFLAGDLLHYSFYTLEEHRLRLQNYARLAAKRLSSKKALRLRSYVNASWRFLQTYFFKGGWLDGKYGFWICLLTAKEVYLKYKWAHQLKVKAN